MIDGLDITDEKRKEIRSWPDQRKREFLYLYMRKRAETAREDYLEFIKYVYPEAPSADADEFLVSWHHERLASQLERLIEGDVNRLAVSMPPRHGKSLMCSRMLPAYLFGRHPDQRVIGVGHGTSFAEKKLSKPTKQIIKTRRYQHVFPDTQIPPKNVDGDDRYSYTNTKGDWDIYRKKGGYYAAGVGSGIDGIGCDLLIVDDPLNEQTARSATYRDKVWEWFASSAMARLSKDAKVLLIMTRWHKSDPVGRILDQMEDRWTYVRYPAVSDEEAVEDPTDPRDTTGEPLWPDRFPSDFLQEQKDLKSRKRWASVYMQKPKPPGGEIVDEQWIEDAYYTRIPRIDRSRLVQSWDLRGGGEGSDSSYAVGQLWCRPHGSPDAYLVDQTRGKWDSPETKRRMERMAQDDPLWSRASAIVVEKKADGRALIPMLKKEISGIVEVNPTGKKEERLDGVSPYFESGNVRLPDPGQDIAFEGPVSSDLPTPDTAWVDGWIDEVTSVPSASHDDQADACSQALDHLLTSSVQTREIDDDEPLVGGVTTGASGSSF